jgi:hypothetical protein
MSNNTTVATIYHYNVVSMVLFWGFIVIKVSGHIFAAWSWWWVLLPIVPWIGEAVRHFGL